MQNEAKTDSEKGRVYGIYSNRKGLEAVRNEYGYAPSTTTVYNDIKVGRIGEPPKERGAKPEYFARKKDEAAAAAAAEGQ